MASRTDELHFEATPKKLGRGALGDAFKAILCIPYALLTEEEEDIEDEVEVEEEEDESEEEAEEDTTENSDEEG